MTVSSIARSRSRPTASGLAKSNRSRSGSTLLPACWACLPRCVCRAWCRTCVAEWARRIASRRSASTSAVTWALTLTVPSVTWPMWSVKSLSFFVSLDLEDEPLAPDHAGVADLAARLAVERRPVEDQDDRRAGASADAVADSARRFCSTMPMTLRVGLGRLVAEELVAVVIRLLERVERAGREDGGGLGRAPRDLASLVLRPPRSPASRPAGSGRPRGSRSPRPGCRRSSGGRTPPRPRSCRSRRPWSCGRCR